ncbi:MAG: hypothetical protein HY089_04785 [Ignavibacteriales bacterium]|nr:hypothetical protein [Ignavibacteriales bacterium]
MAMAIQCDSPVISDFTLMEITMKIEILVQLLGIIVGGIVGYILKGFIDKHNEKETRFFERKEERYKILLELTIQIYREKEDRVLQKVKADFLRAYDFSWLYASDSVIKSIQQFIDSLRQGKIDTNRSMQLVGQIVIEMRNDLKNETRLTPLDWKPVNPN